MSTENQMEGDDLKVRAMAGLHEEVLRLAVDLHRPGSAVLDIAAGSGVLTKLLHETLGDAVVHANELSEDNWVYDGVVPTRFNLDAPFAHKFADAGVRPRMVLAVEVIEHLENPRGFLRGLHELLPDDGVAIVTTPNINSSRGRIGFLRHGRPAYFSEKIYPDHGHISILPFWLLRLHAEAVGFGRVGIHFAGSPRNRDTPEQKARDVLAASLTPFMKASCEGELERGATVMVARK